MVSLKEKIQAIRQPVPLKRSKSSKMLQDMLSQSRRSQSISRRSEQDNGQVNHRNDRQNDSLSKQNDSLECHNQSDCRNRLGSSIGSSNKEKESNKVPLTTRPILNLNCLEENIDPLAQNALKNLVKNKLNKKDNAHKLLKPLKKENPIMPEPKQVVHIRNIIQQNSSNSHPF